MNGCAPVVVLVEGESDVAALAALAPAYDGLDRVEVRAMGGVTNAARHVDRVRADRPGVVLLGLCDAGERRFLDRLTPPLDAVFVCDRDLEEELIRALGAARVLEVLAELEELGRFRTFRGQPEWRDRPVEEQLRRFAGTRSGRKAVLAAAMAGCLTRETMPPPLARLLAEVAVVGSDR